MCGSGARGTGESVNARVGSLYEKRKRDDRLWGSMRGKERENSIWTSTEKGKGKAERGLRLRVAEISIAPDYREVGESPSASVSVSLR